MRFLNPSSRASRRIMWISIYIYNVFASLDQTANAVLGGDKDQTISARIWQAEREGQRWAKWCVRPLVDALFAVWESEHCRKAFLADPERDNSIWKMHARWVAGEPMIA